MVVRYRLDQIVNFIFYCRTPIMYSNLNTVPIHLTDNSCLSLKLESFIKTQAVIFISHRKYKKKRT